jgi:hypothetical protein
MKPNFFVAALAAAALAGPCFADVAPTGGNGAAPAASPTAAPAATLLKHGYDPNTLICKSTDEIGTRLGRTKVCMTRAQWDQQSRDAQDDLADTTRRGGEGAPPGN